MKAFIIRLPIRIRLHFSTFAIMRKTLGKSEKLKSKQLIGELFLQGKHCKTFPFQLIYLPQSHPSETQLKVAFSVPKRNLKSAVQRNRVKRKMREIYRQYKQEITKDLPKPYFCMFIYTAKEIHQHDVLNEAFLKLSKTFIRLTSQDN